MNYVPCFVDIDNDKIKKLRYTIFIQDAEEGGVVLNEEKLLKRATIYSLILMVCIVTFSIGMRMPQESISYASEITKTPMPSIELEQEITEVTNEIEETHIEKQFITSLDEEILEKYGNNLIVVRKPKDLVKDYTYDFEEYAVDRRIVLTITGLSSEVITADDIYRFYENQYMNGPSKEVMLSPVPAFIPTSLLFSTSYPFPTTLSSPTTIPFSTTIPLPTDSVTNINITYSTTPDNVISAEITMDLIKTYAYLLEEDEKFFYICLVDPHDVYDKIIVLDAGHGGNDSGTYSSGYSYLEKTMNLDMLLRLQEYFIDNENIKIYTTRTTDRRLTLNQRVDLANDVGADLFLSIHCNASKYKSIHGTEVLYNENQDDWNTFNSKQFAQICLEELVDNIGLKNRGIVARGSDVHIIGESQVPVALVEVAFMSNKDDMDFLKEDENRQIIAEGIYNGIIRALEAKNIEDK